MGWTRRHLTYANVIGTLALFVALGGGAYAVSTAKRNSVTSRSVRNESIKGVDVLNDSLTGLDVDEGSLELPVGPKGPKGDVGPTAAEVSSLLDNPVTTPDFLADSVHVDVPAPGRMLAVYATKFVRVDCTAGDPTIGLYVDGVPVPRTQRLLTDNVAEPPTVLIGITAGTVPSGDRAVTLAADCASGGVVSIVQTATSVTGILVGQ